MDNNSTLALALAAGAIAIIGAKLAWKAEYGGRYSFFEWVAHLRQRKPRDIATLWVWEGASKMTSAWQHGAWGLVVGSYEAASEVMNNPNKFPKLLSEEGSVLDCIMGNNMLFSNGDDWKLYRHTLNPGFRTLPNSELLTSSVEELMLVIDQKDVVDIHPLLQRTAMDFVGKALLDLDLHTVTSGGEFLELFNRMVLAAYDPFCIAFPWLSRKSNPLRSDVKKGLEELDEFVSGLAAANQGPAAGLMRQAGFAEKQVRDNAMLLLLPSLTTASTATMILHHLARNPEIQEKARAEVKQVLDGKLPNAENINSMAYLAKIIKETMRICPEFAQLPPRYANEDCTLGGIAIKKGTSIVIDALAMHRNPEYYPDPLVFNPDRDAGKVPFYSFGGGSRLCIGLNLAKLELKVITAMLLTNYSISYPEGVESPLDPMYTPAQLLVPTSVKLVFEKLQA